jgi:hypothetical protein
MAVHTCRQVENPRHPGYCACGQRLPEFNASKRDGAYEAAFLKEAAATAERRFGIPTTAFIPHVLRGLADGERLYGDRWLEIDLGHEAAEEARDAGAYAVLEAQKRLFAGVDDPALWHAQEIAIHAAAIHYHALCLARNVD